MVGDLEHLPAALRHLRNLAGYKQKEVAEGSGITRALISAYESGRQTPSIPNLFRVLEFMDFTLIDLHDALATMKGNVVVVPVDVVLPLWARPLVVEVVKLLVSEVAAAERAHRMEEE